jgi:hypothetical protein
MTLAWTVFALALGVAVGAEVTVGFGYQYPFRTQPQRVAACRHMSGSYSEVPI